jgi:hypothetical protein
MPCRWLLGWTRSSGFRVLRACGHSNRRRQRAATLSLSAHAPSIERRRMHTHPTARERPHIKTDTDVHAHGRTSACSLQCLFRGPLKSTSTVSSNIAASGDASRAVTLHAHVCGSAPLALRREGGRAGRGGREMTGGQEGGEGRSGGAGREEGGVPGRTPQHSWR